MTAERPKKANCSKKVDMWERGLSAGLPLTGVSLEKQQRAAPASTTLTPPVKLALCCSDNGMHVHTCKKRVMLRSRLFWPKKICGKSAKIATKCKLRQKCVNREN